MGCDVGVEDHQIKHDGSFVKKGDHHARPVSNPVGEKKGIQYPIGPRSKPTIINALFLAHRLPPLPLSHPTTPPSTRQTHSGLTNPPQPIQIARRPPPLPHCRYQPHYEP